MTNPEDWDIPQIVAAVVADDPDAAVIADGLTKSLGDVCQGRFETVPVSDFNEGMESK